MRRTDYVSLSHGSESNLCTVSMHKHCHFQHCSVINKHSLTHRLSAFLDNVSATGADLSSAFSSSQFSQLIIQLLSIQCLLNLPWYSPPPTLFPLRLHKPAVWHYTVLHDQSTLAGSFATFTNQCPCSSHTQQALCS